MVVKNKGGFEMPAMPPPPAPAPPPTLDNSEEVKKQRLIEEQRAIRAKGLGATDLTKDGVPLIKENIETPKATKTLLGE